MSVQLVQCHLCGRVISIGRTTPDGTGRRCTAETPCAKRVRAKEREANAGRCIDCVEEGVTTERVIASAPGQPLRCLTHLRSRRKAARIAAHASRVQSGYGISGEQYWALYEAQGGTCAICQVATGKTKRLAVDHDHACQEGHDPKQGCPKCIRGLLCGPCNELIGRYRNEKLVRAITYRLDPPARGVLNA